MKRLLGWLGDRTGLGGPVRRCLFDPIPGGARWRHVWSTVVAFTFLMQVITGFFLLTNYSPGMQTAWESVHHLQAGSAWGAALRGLHAVAAQAFVVVLALHLLQMVIHRLYRAPRELDFLLLLLLLLLALKMSVTGWMLPFDQKGFWAARVPLNLIGLIPVLGPLAQKLTLGGAEVTHLTLTRMAAFHTVYFPALIALVLGLYLVMTHRHRGSLPARPQRGVEPWWPHQAWRDAAACLAVAVVVGLVVVRPMFHGGAPGVELLAPADPGEPYAAARPEWFMLWLFQFLKLFPGEREILGAVVIPGATLLVLALMPWIGRWRAGAVFNTGFVLLIAAGAVFLGVRAVQLDRADPAYRQAVAQAAALAERADVLAGSPVGIPPEGALSLLRNDPLTQGPRLFARHCASCHRYDGHDGLGAEPADPPTAADLKGFGSREWVAGILDPARISTVHHFGGTAFKARKMVKFVNGDLADLDEEVRTNAVAAAVAAVSAEAGLKSQRAADAADQALIEQGRKMVAGEPLYCNDCHQFRKPDEDATAPDLTGYASREWLIAFIGDPAQTRFYGRKNDRMPSFARDGILTEREIGLLADWLRGEWYEPGELAAE